MLKRKLACVGAAMVFATSSTFSMNIAAAEEEKYAPTKESEISVLGADVESNVGETHAPMRAGDRFRIEGPKGTKANLLGEEDFLEVVKPSGQVGLYIAAPAGLKFSVKDKDVEVVNQDSTRSAKANTVPTKATFGLSLIDRVEVEEHPEGKRYKVFPTALGRAMRSPIPETVGWNEAKSKGVADTGSLHNQFVCHPLSQVARVKSSWNLEDWRPDVGLPGTLKALCNPGGGDD